MAQTLARPLITSRIDESTLVTLQGNTRPEATVANDRGRVADATRMEHMFLLLQRAPEREEALRTMIDQLHDPKSANFHHWLTPQQIGQSYGVGQADTSVDQRWLESHGFTVNQTYPEPA
jgi:subtilase family serine protease